MSERKRIIKTPVVNDGILHTRNLILRLMCGVYLAAFSSFYYQSPGYKLFHLLMMNVVPYWFKWTIIPLLNDFLGLFGSNGILPARNYIETTTSTFVAFRKTPTLLHFGFAIGLDTEKMMDLVCVFGMVLSFLGYDWNKHLIIKQILAKLKIDCSPFSFITVKCCILPIFATMWILYFSLFQITDVFGDQSDQLLLEASFICIALAPLYRNRHSMPTDKIAVVLMKWILFRWDCSQNGYDSIIYKFLS